MARHEVIIHENPGLGELAPYTGNYISKETLNVKAFAEAVGAKCGLHAIQVRPTLTKDGFPSQH